MLKLFMKSRNQKGFTLVELIVVLVILGILAAILVPTMIGWIDKSKEAQYQLEARSVLMAAQGVLSEAYGKNVNLSSNDLALGYLNTEAQVNQIKKLSSVKLDGTPGTNSPFISATIVPDAYVSNSSGTPHTKITALNFKFESASGSVLVDSTYNSSGWKFSY